jgi:uncharacterized protein (DUF486 family)
MDDRLKAATLLLAGHLRFKNPPPRLWVVILVSWGIALFEYILQVPANRIGYRVLSAYQLKIMQEALSLVVFMIFAALFLGEGMQVRYFISFVLVMLAVLVAFR